MDSQLSRDPASKNQVVIKEDTQHTPLVSTTDVGVPSVAVITINE